jgi:hypothetical protein
MFIDFSKTGRWRRRFKAKYPYVYDQPPETGALRLVLGAGRSGTSWVSKVLSKTGLPCRFSNEPLFHIKPPLPFHCRGDHTAMRYDGETDPGPLLAAYQLAMHPEFDGGGLPGNEREDANWEICLIKEVHALLGSEALLRAWKVPVIFILRDPMYIIDSLFAAQTIDTTYMDHEVVSVRGEAFLDRFAGGAREAVRQALAENAGRQHRGRVLLDKLICAQLLQRMFTTLALEFPQAKAFAYEDFCVKPAETFAAAALALNMPWDATMASYLRNTMKANETAAADPYAVQRDTAAQKDRAFRFLKPEEVALCRSTIAAIAPPG